MNTEHCHWVTDLSTLQIIYQNTNLFPTSHILDSVTEFLTFPFDMICPRLHAATPKKSWSSRFELEESISYTSNFRSCSSSNRYDICTFDAKSGSCVFSITSVRWNSTHLASPNGRIYVTHIGSDFDNKSFPGSPLKMNKKCNKNQHFNRFQLQGHSYHDSGMFEKSAKRLTCKTT